MSRREWLCYTDGSCKIAHGGAGGWGVLIDPPPGGGEAIERYGKELGTEAKVMEYRAVAEALALLPERATAIVYSDNLALVENLGKKLDVWRTRGFTKVDPAILTSVRAIASALEDRSLTVRFEWVRGHHSNEGNARADALAAQGAREAKASRQQ